MASTIEQVQVAMLSILTPSTAPIQSGIYLVLVKLPKKKGCLFCCGLNILDMPTGLEIIVISVFW